MFAQPQAEHSWLTSLVGNWLVESECRMGPDQAPMAITGRTTIRDLGGLWILMEGESDSPEGEPCKSIMTLGYDSTAKKYVGSFIASVMSNQWIYTGELDESQRKLTLDTVGPRFDMSGMANYQDMVEKVDEDHWILSSQVQGEDGSWLPFMSAHHRRQK